MLEEIFQIPYEELFGPNNGSPLFIDQERNKEGNIVHTQPQFSRETITDIYRNKIAEPVSNPAELIAAFGEQQISDIPVKAVAAGRAGRLVVELGESKRQWPW